MNIPVTRTKYLLPRRRADVLSRPRLLEMVNDLLDNRLIIIAAPAGYGKTTLLVDMADHTNMPFCWYALDPLDRDFKRFVTYLIASINHRFPDFGERSSLILQNISQADPDLDQLITTIVNEAYDSIREHFTVVLDDYHFVDDQPEINQFLGRFIQEMDDNCHVIVASRTLLSLPDLPLMVARSQVGGLGFDELAFQADEIKTLIQQNYSIAISENTALDLAQETEGWITGLLLSSQASWQGMNDRLRLARVSAVGLYEYLAQQVLEQQPEVIRDFLLKTSLLEEFDADLCTEVLGPPPEEISNWGSLLDTILHSNLFVLPVGEKGLWLRYHHLFRDFLQNRFHQDFPNEAREITRRLANVYAQRAEWERAYVLFSRLGLAQDLVSLVENAGPHLQKAGRFSTLVTWIDALPPDAVSANPGILSLRGSVAIMVSEVDRGLALLNHSIELYQMTTDLFGKALAHSRRSHAHRFLGHYQDALKDADLAISIARENGSLLQPILAESLRSRGICLFRLGFSGEGVECIKEASGIFDSVGSLESMASAQIELGMIYRTMGEFNQARYAYENALPNLKRLNLTLRQSAALNNLGVLYQHLGEYEKSGTYLEQSLQLAEQSGNLRMQAVAICSIGDLYRVLSAPDAAEKAYERAQEIVIRLSDRFLIFYLSIALAASHRMCGNPELAQEKLAQARGMLTGENSPYEMGIWNLENGRQFLQAQNLIDGIDALTKACEYFDRGQQRIEQIQAQLLLSYVCKLSGEPEPSAIHLKRALQLAERMDNSHTLIESFRETSPLLAVIYKDPEINRQIPDLASRLETLERSLPVLRRRLRRQVSVVPFSAPRLTIRALGRIQVLVDGRAVTSSQWQTQVSRDLLFLLLANPEGLTKEAIAGIFWPDSNPSQVKLQFKNTVYRLRHALEQDVVLFEDEHYYFNKSLDYEYDVENFLNKTSQAQTSPALEKKINALESAIHLYKGIFLPDVDGTWSWLMRERLHQAYQAAVLDLSEYYVQSGDHHSALKNCQDILAKDACLEEAYRLTMRIYAAMGNKAGIVRQYERCEQALLRELNLPPSPQTKNLFETLIR